MPQADIKAGTVAHANLGASSAHRWMKCPGSVRLSKDMPDKSSRYARLGTAAHELAAMCLETERDALSFLGENILVEPDMFEVDREMANAVQKYLDFCRALGDRGDCRVETRFSLDKLDPPAPMFGTADFTRWDPEKRHLDVVDYKHGRGKAVDVEYNAQLMYYALGAVLAYHVKPDQLRVTIVQPRADHPDGIIRSWQFSWDLLVDFKELLIEKAEAATKPDAKVGPVGDHCQWCPAKPVCPAQQENAMQVAQSEFDDLPEEGPPPPEKLSREQIIQILEAGPMLEDFLSEVRDYAQRVLEEGGEVPGFKLVEKRGRRNWKDDDEAESFMEKHGIDPYRHKLRSPYQAEQEAKKLDDVEVPEELWEKKSTGLKLAPADHPRPAVTPASQAEEEFEALPGTQTESEETSTEEEGTQDEGVRATKAARRVAEEHGVDLTEIEGTGHEGRVLKGDVQDAIS